MMGTNDGLEFDSRGYSRAPAADGSRGGRDAMADTPDVAVLRLIAESSPHGVLVATPDGTIVFCNRGLERLFGHAPGELLGRSILSLVPEASSALQHLERTGSLDAGSTAAPGAARLLLGRRRDGCDIPVEVGMTTAATAGGPRVVATVVDVTSRLHREDGARATIDGQAFEALLSELSAMIGTMGPRPGAIAQGLSDALGRIGEQMGLDGVTLLSLDDGAPSAGEQQWTRPAAGCHVGPVGERDLPWTCARLRAGAIVAYSTLVEVSDAADRGTFNRRGTHAAVAIAIARFGGADRAVLFESRGERRWTPDLIGRLQLLANLVADLRARRERDATLLQTLDDTEAVRDELEAENVVLRRHSKRLEGTEYIVGRSAALRQTLRELRQVAATDATVLLLGETGTGKELLAEHVHALSARHGRSMVRVSCAVIPSTLIESELFGREKGAYTGAISRQVGRFELAHNSTIFLDEIGDVPLDVQVKLLRVLEDKHVERLGGSNRVRVDVRVVAATNRDLEKSVAAGEFREDLYYRLNVFPIRVPPLRERTEDIPLLVWRFVEEFTKSFGKRIDAIPDDNMEALRRYPWPGNVRELRNVVERAVISTSSRELTIAMPSPQGSPLQRSLRLEDVERQHILSVLDLTHWRIRGEQGAAIRLGLKPTTLETRMAKLGIHRAHRAR